MDGQANDKALQKFADLMVKKIEEVSNDPKQNWFSMVGHGLPQNIEGRVYNGINSFMLFLLQENNSYTTPVYMTFAQAKKQGLRVNKGESAFPVLFWNFLIKDKNGDKITMDQYRTLSKEEQKEYTVFPYTKPYAVFNVDQTNFENVYPERWKELQQQFNVRELKDEAGMFSCKELDYILKNEAWLCPIITRTSDSAFYRPSEDKIYLPLKGQFYTGEGFYSDLLHEMAHSTGIESRLGRDMKHNAFGDPKYAKEELVAEFTAAVCCRSLGIVSGVRDENAKYLKHWLGAIKKEPKFLYTVLVDTGKASTMILNEVCKLEQQKKEEQEKQQEVSKAEENKKVNESKAFSTIRNDEGLSPAFNIALAAALAGSFKELVNLKEQGHKLSVKELDALKDADPKIYIAAQNIFNIKLDVPTPSLQFPESKNKNEVKQLSLNF